MATDNQIFLDLLDQHGSVAMALLRRLCGSLHDAEDIFQDVALRVWRNLRSRPRLRNARSWLMTIAYHAFLDHQARRPSSVPYPEHEALVPASPGVDPVMLAERAECRLMVEAEVMKLSPPIRSVIVLHYTGGLSLREIADAMAISVGTVKSRLSAGLEQLRRRLP